MEYKPEKLAAPMVVSPARLAGRSAKVAPAVERAALLEPAVLEPQAQAVERCPLRGQGERNRRLRR